VAKEGPSRRDLFRLLGRPLSNLAGAPGDPPRAGWRPDTGAAPPDEAPIERGRLVVDLDVRPIPVGTGRRFLPAGRDGSVLVARVSESHLAALPGDCPRCAGALRYDAARDVVACGACEAAFRLDGSPLEEYARERLPSYPVRRAGPRVEIDLPLH
jgi:hypothetical protein